MEVTDIFLRELTVDGSSPPNDKLRRKLFDAIRKGDSVKVRSLSQLNCDFNCVDSSGKTALQVAGDLKDVTVRKEIFEVLLSGGADIEFALLHAVRETSLKTVKILLQFHKKALPGSRAKVADCLNQGYVTPLILAACLQNFQIVSLLLEHGFTIGDTKRAQRSSGSNGFASEKLGPAVYRLNEYRALASPVFIAASFLQNVQSGLDPVHRACVLNKELRDMAEQEYEFKNKYFELSDGCKEFSVALLNECHSMEEIRCVMEIQNKGGMKHKMEGKCLNILEFAIVTQNDEFVSHPYSQLVLNSEVYRNVPFLEKSAWKQAVLILLASVLYPMIFMIWFVFDNCFPNYQVVRMFHSPCVKFLIYCGCYQTFLFFLAFTSFHFQSEFLKYGITDWIVLAYVIGHLIDVIKDVYHQGRVHFFSYHWNYLAVASVTSFIIHYVIWWAGRAVLTEKPDSMKWESHATDHGYAIMLVSYCFLAVGILLAFAQNLSFVQANSSTGPLLHAFIQMLIDVAKFFLYFVFVFIAFAVSFTKLYLQYEKARRHFLLNTTGTNQTDPLHLERFGSSMETIFWTLFGEIGEDSFKIDVEGYGAIWKTGMTLFGVFNIVAVLVALNMLIAILNDSYTRITENLDTEWKFTRTKLWLTWVYKKGVLPPPFNILYVLLPVRWVMKRLFTACSPGDLLLLEKLAKKSPRGSISKVKRIDENERREVIRHLVLRYLAKTLCSSETGTESSDSEQDNNATVTTENQDLTNWETNL